VGKIARAFGRLVRHATLTEEAIDHVPNRGSRSGVIVTPESALRTSAVWASLRLRSDLVSTLPLDAYRYLSVAGESLKIEIPKPPVLVDPDGSGAGLCEWLYSSQMDLDRYGNTFGLVTEKNALGLPARIELVAAGDVAVRVTKGVVKYRIKGIEYGVGEVWHERQYTVAGLPVGLSPIAYAAWTLAATQSAQEFATDWFSHDAVPSGHLRNKGKVLAPGVSEAVKDKFRAAVTNHDVFVSGNDWEYTMIGVPGNQAAFIDQMRWSATDVARFFGVPAGMIDAESGSSMTYSTVTQQNLQLLIMHLGPILTRRERALSRLLPTPRFVKFNRDAILASDPAGRAAHLKILIDSRTLAPSEARAIEDRPPFTDEQLTEFDRLFGAKTPTPIAGAPTNGAKT
jgi:HK97 family phage portal protein